MAKQESEVKQFYALAIYQDGKWHTIDDVFCDGPHFHRSVAMGFPSAAPGPRPLPTEPPAEPQDGDVVQYLAVTYGPDGAIHWHHPTGYDPTPKSHGVYTVTSGGDSDAPWTVNRD